MGAANDMHGTGAKQVGGGAELWTQDASYDNTHNTSWVDFLAIPSFALGKGDRWPSYVP